MKKTHEQYHDGIGGIILFDRFIDIEKNWLGEVSWKLKLKINSKVEYRNGWMGFSIHFSYRKNEFPRSYSATSFNENQQWHSFNPNVMNILPFN